MFYLYLPTYTILILRNKTIEIVVMYNHVLFVSEVTEHSVIINRLSWIVRSLFTFGVSTELKTSNDFSEEVKGKKNRPSQLNSECSSTIELNNTITKS